MNFRQKFSRYILCFSLSISVFFCSFNLALADDSNPADEIGFEVDGGSTRTVGLISLSKGDYGYAQQYIDNNFTLILKPGYVYNGQITCRYSLTYTSRDISGYWTSVCDVSVRSSLADIGVAYNYFKKTGDLIYFDLIMTFNGLYVESELPITVSATILFGVNGQITEEHANVGSVSMSVAGDFASRNWTATLPTDYNEGAIIVEQGALDREQQSQISQQEMAQQQQIADQQAQQSAQQHEDLKNGFQDDTYNSNVSNAGNTVDNYISVESDLMNSQNQIMSNYTDTAFNTGTIAPFTNAIAMCSTWYTWIWNSFAELNVAFVVVLAVGVACLIVGIKKRG